MWQAKLFVTRIIFSIGASRKVLTLRVFLGSNNLKPNNSSPASGLDEIKKVNFSDFLMRPVSPRLLENALKNQQVQIVLCEVLLY